jgi:PAS domain S-box-containing protein
MTHSTLTTPHRSVANAIRLAVVDPELKVLACTPALASTLGVDPATVAGQPLLARVHPDDRAALVSGLERVRFSGSEHIAQHIRFRTAGGVWREDKVHVARVESLEGHETYALLMDTATSAEPTLAERLDEAERARKRSGNHRPGHLSLDALSPREREVLALVLDGYRVSTIARSMYLSPSTVRNHLSAIFRKFGVTSQAELVEELHRVDLDHAV